MRAVWVTKHGGPEVLEVRETPDPEPGAGEVRVRAKACGLNFAEVMARQGLYPDAPKPPMVVGYEGAGVVDKVGAGVTEHAVGDRVWFLIRFGAHADTVVVPVAQAIKMPDAMTFEEGAAIPVNYLTAYHMLFRLARVRPGEHVLVHQAAGGVGTALLQLAKTVPDLRTYGTASASKHEHLRSLGCHHPIDYRTTDYVEEVKKLTGGRGVHAVFDALGGGDWKKGYSILRPAGILVAFGFANVNKGGRRSLWHALKQVVKIPKYSPMKLMGDNKAVAGLNLGHLWGEVPMLQEELLAIRALYEQGVFKPHIGGTYPFSRAGEAFEELAQGRNTGKVVLTPD